MKANQFDNKMPKSQLNVMSTRYIEAINTAEVISKRLILNIFLDLINNLLCIFSIHRIL